jgi:hypothetical protein
MEPAKSPKETMGRCFRTTVPQKRAMWAKGNAAHPTTADVSQHRWSTALVDATPVSFEAHVLGICPSCALPPAGKARSQQPRARVIAEEMGIAHIAAQRVHTPMAALVHHLKIEAPRPAADVRKPERSEWPAKSL